MLHDRPSERRPVEPRRRLVPRRPRVRSTTRSPEGAADPPYRRTHYRIRIDGVTLSQREPIGFSWIVVTACGADRHQPARYLTPPTVAQQATVVACGNGFAGFRALVVTGRRQVTRGHRVSNGPWWFSSSGGGRFDLSAPRGTCYVAFDEATAIRETVGRRWPRSG
ncbi:hypothetical protein RHA1_ro08723 (plasmid) [Rhodococcus jostii RHA1]|uniref:RES domain-containing protein n=1 Tax=Rhodococcus jostii (strain RHA1) TaxID=101510 RepID=Q0RY69_RHOJR|nr:hypothetical protein RHA1_ro08723 [Rhodococcus jostii RHA1]